VNRNLDRKGSRLCVVRDARHAHKTQARWRFFLGKNCSVRHAAGSIDATPGGSSGTIGRTR
jgi:hypothetical protein